MAALDSEYYDGWYTDVINSPARDDVVRRALGLPAELESTGALGWDALAEVLATIEATPADTVVDLACGRGGYGFEVARRTGARVVGVDFSAVAIRHARRRAEELGLADRTEFRVADMAHTGLPTASADAVLCVDSIHFADPVGAALRECRRILKPGGRVALTAWQVSDDTDKQTRRRMPHRDLAVQLDAAGFARVTVTERRRWCAAEQQMWIMACGLETAGDPALRAMQEEARLVLSVFHLRHRVFAIAVAPLDPVPAEVRRPGFAGAAGIS